MHITPYVILNAKIAPAPVSRSGGDCVMDRPLFAECGFGLAACDAACDEHSQRVDRGHDGIRVGQAPDGADAVDEAPQQRQESKPHPFEDLVEPVGQPVGLALILGDCIGHMFHLLSR